MTSSPKAVSDLSLSKVLRCGGGGWGGGMGGGSGSSGIPFHHVYQGLGESTGLHPTALSDFGLSQ